MALLWQTHVHNERVTRWQDKVELAVCPLTELGFRVERGRSQSAAAPRLKWPAKNDFGAPFCRKRRSKIPTAKHAKYAKGERSNFNAKPRTREGAKGRRWADRGLKLN